MRVKTFEADSTPEAMREIRRELGPDAIIVRTEETKPGARGLFGGKARVQVTAALPAAKGAPGTKVAARKATADRAPAGLARAPVADDPVARPPADQAALREMQQQVRELRGVVARLS